MATNEKKEYLDELLAVDITFDNMMAEPSIAFWHDPESDEAMVRLTFTYPDGGSMVVEAKMKELLNTFINLSAQTSKVLEGIMEEMWNDGMLCPKTSNFDDCRMHLLNDNWKLTDDCTAQDEERVKLYVAFCNLIVPKQ